MAEETDKKLTDDIAETPVDALDLSVEVYRTLRRTGISTVGDVLDLLEKGDTAVMSIRNFNHKSLDDLRQKMVEKEYLKDELASTDNVVMQVNEVIHDFNNKVKEIQENMAESNIKNENEIVALKDVTTDIKGKVSNFIENNIDLIVAAAKAKTNENRLAYLEEAFERDRTWGFNKMSLTITIISILLGAVIAVGACLFGAIVTFAVSYLFR